MRKPRSLLVVPGSPHHVVLRGNNRRRLFSYADDYHQLLWYMWNAKSAAEVLIHALVLMTNHLHLLVTPTSVAGMSSFVGSFAQRYAQYRNRRRGTSGKLWESRFWCDPILDERHLAVTTAYVELNPVRAGMVRDPLDYPWSTVGHQVGEPERSKIMPQLWTPSDWYRGLGASLEESADQYRRWIADVRAQELAPSRAQQIALLEQVDEPYSLRLRRPDSTSAREPRGPEYPGSLSTGARRLVVAAG